MGRRKPLSVAKLALLREPRLSKAEKTNIEKAWKIEIHRRLADLRAGKTKCIPAEEAMRNAYRALDRMDRRRRASAKRPLTTGTTGEAWMNCQLTIQFTEEHIKYACRKFFVRYLGIKFPVLWTVMIVFFAQRVVAGKMDLLAGCALALVIVSVGVFVSAYFQRCGYALSQFRKTGRVVSYDLSEEFFKAKSDLGSTELKWLAFKGIWIFPKVWLLMVDRATYLTLPQDQVGNDVKEFLKQKIISVGGKIK